MKITKKKLLLLAMASTTLLVLPISHVSCTSKTDDNLLMKNTFIVDGKRIQYAAFNNLLPKYISTKNEWSNKDHLKIKPDVINSVAKLYSVLGWWRVNFNKNITNYKNPKTLFVTKGFDEGLQAIFAHYTKEWFSENTLLIDYGGLIGTETTNHGDTLLIENKKAFAVDKIIVKDQEIDLVYKEPAIKYESDLYFPILIEMKNKDFDLKENQTYHVTKKWDTNVEEVKLEDREVNAFAYLNLGLASSYLKNKYKDWSKIKREFKPYNEVKRITDLPYDASKIVTTKKDFDLLISTYQDHYEAKAKELNQKSGLSNYVVNNMKQLFDRFFFKNNVLVVVSLSEWARKRIQSDSVYAKDYHANLKGNILEITFYEPDKDEDSNNQEKFGFSVNPEFIREEKFYNAIDLNKNNDGSNAWLFFAIDKNKVKNIESLKTNISLKQYKDYTE
ncbi:hypothetical protein [Mycoplasmopsis agassizii]|uniref:Lipoprotein n=1 Tax=Mycoplasmopsis agassizii TaxID=33922 RepID=A0ABX4H4R6_9BACT|nr:hypothetical protein [Mycoplasmopsis agassizii]PAF54881.1 hypothetical protein CJF60_04050 [Mycoplasmopsis agassizii]SMC20010.1 hypothetical protein SAMN02745179_00985 [Mycoplasmopsis agassizii]